MEIRDSYLRMIRAMSGGWGAMCGALCMSRNALENRIYERTGSGVLVDTALMMQKLSGSTFFAEAVAAQSGGTFVKLPEMGNDNVVIQSKFQELYIELGRFSQDYATATADDVIDKGERKMLEADGARLHKVVAELMALTFRVYCPNGGEHDGSDA